MLICILACSLAFHAITFKHSTFTKMAKFKITQWYCCFVVPVRFRVKKSFLKISAGAYLLFNVMAMMCTMCTKFYVSPCRATLRSEKLILKSA